MGAAGQPKTPGSGRRAGEPNRDTLQLRERLAAADFDLVDEIIHLHGLAMAAGELSIAASILMKLTRHVYPTLRSIDVSAKVDAPPPVVSISRVIKRVAPKQDDSE